MIKYNGESNSHGNIGIYKHILMILSTLSMYKI